MATRVAIDTVSGVGSLKGLKDAISATTNAWKAEEIALKSSGDAVGAAQAKYNGLGDTIDRQKAKIEELRTRQNGLDTTTQKGAESYLKLQKQLESSTKQLSSLESQQDRAKSSMNYYTSGLAELQKGYRQAGELSNSYVERLKAEGQTEKANKAQLNGLKQSLSNLTEQYDKQESELRRVASESGLTSEAYKKQAIRVNETGTSVAKTRTKISELNDSMSKPHTSFLSGVKDKLSGVNNEASKTSKIGSRVKDFVTGTLIAQGISNLASKTMEWAKSGFESAEAAVEVGERWKNIGINDYGVKQLGASTKSLKENTNLSATAVGNMLTKFYGMTGSVKQAQDLANGVGSLADKLKLSQQQSDGFANGLSKIEASGKVTSQSLTRLEKQAPGLSTALAKSAGMSQDGFNKLVASGKMTSTQFNNILDKASKDYGKNSEEFDKSSAGAMHHLQVGWADTKQALMKPLVNVAGTGMDALNKALDNPATQKAVTQLGQGIANLATKSAGLVDYLSAHTKDITSITSSIVEIAKIIGETIWKTFVDVTVDISKAFGNFGSNAKKSKDPLDQLSNALAAIAKHKTAIADLTKVFLGLMATKKVLGFTSALTGLGSKMIFKPKVDSKDAGRDLTAFGNLGKKVGIKIGSSLKWTAQVAKSGAEKAVSALWSGIKGTGKLIGKSLKFTAKLAYSGAKKSLSLLWSGIRGTGKLIGKGLQFTAKIAVSAAKTALSGLLKAAQVTGKGLKAAFNFAKANPFILIVSAIAAVVVALVELYKHNAKFRKFVNGLIKSAKDAWKNVTKFFKNMYKDTVGQVGKMIGSISKSFNSMKSTMSKRTSEAWKSTKSSFSNGWNNVKSSTSSGVSKVGSFFSNMRKNTTRESTNMFNSHKATFRSGYRVMQDYTGTFHDVMNGKWNRIGSDLKRTANDLTNFWRRIFKGVYDWLNNITGGRLGDMLNKFRSVFGQIKGVISGAEGGIKHAFTGIVRGIFSPFNSMLSGLKKGINWVLDKVGASKISASWSIPLPSYATGTKDTHQGGLALVNDSKSTHYQEMYHFPSGQIGMFPAVHDMVVPLPKGTSVLDGEKSFQLSKVLGLPHYASGIGSFFKGMWNKGKDILEDTDKIIAHPIEFMKSVFAKYTSGIKASAGLATDIVKNLPGTIAKGASGWIKKLFSDFAGDGGPSSGNPGGSGVQRWKSDVKKALAANKLSTSAAMVAKVLRQITTESGGNPAARQGGADPDGDGSGPALGLMQTKRSTFNANAFSGHKQIFNGYDNLLAGLLGLRLQRLSVGHHAS